MTQVVFGANQEVTAGILNQATQGFKFLRRATFAGSQGSPVGSGSTAVSCGTWTPGSGTSAIFVRACGPGGGGGSAFAAGVGSPFSSVGGGGGGGGYSEKWILSGFGASQVVRIGLGGQGAGVTHTVGGTGAASQFGTLLSAGPGTGGSRIVDIPSSGTYFTTGGNGGAGSLGDINATGAPGEYGFSYSFKPLSGRGGQSAFGGAGGPEAQGSNDGQPGTIFGGGGSGAAVDNPSGPSKSGGAGAAGFVTIDEFA